VQLAPLYQPLRKEVDYGSIECLVMTLDKGLTASGHQSIALALRGAGVG
jgi:hypothetical protein